MGLAMALVIGGKTSCPLCDLIIGQDDQIVGTTHFIVDTADPLWRFSDAAMHKRCFLEWDQRKAFVAKFNQFAGRSGRRMTEDGSILS
jgi:hypothetical protein